MVLNFKEDKPTVYKIAQVSFPAISYNELVNECSLSCGVNPSNTEAVIAALCDRLVHYMEIGHPVKLGRFGSFKPAFRAKTTLSLDDANASTVTQKLVRFFPGKQFRDMIANLSVQGAEELDEEKE